MSVYFLSFSSILSPFIIDYLTVIFKQYDRLYGTWSDILPPNNGFGENSLPQYTRHYDLCLKSFCNLIDEDMAKKVISPPLVHFLKALTATNLPEGSSKKLNKA